MLAVANLPEVFAGADDAVRGFTARWVGVDFLYVALVVDEKGLPFVPCLAEAGLGVVALTTTVCVWGFVLERKRGILFGFDWLEDPKSISQACPRL
jgi:hypothetical protein